MSDPLVVYSTATKLALHIASRNYGDIHYVWCAPAPTSELTAFANPPSSDPFHLYWQLKRDMDGGDAHSAVVLQNRNGIKRGAIAKYNAGTIDERDRDRIARLADLAEMKHFEPMFLVIPCSGVRTLANAVDLEDRAKPTSEEYIIGALPRHLFDIIKIEGPNHGR